MDLSLPDLEGAGQSWLKEEEQQRREVWEGLKYELALEGVGLWLLRGYTEENVSLEGTHQLGLGLHAEKLRSVWGVLGGIRYYVCFGKAV